MNLCMAPSSVSTWPARSGNCRTRSSSTSPTVPPLACTEAWPPACWRSTVGRRTSGTTSILPALEGDGLLLDGPVEDAEGAQNGLVVLQRDDHVVPARVGGLGHVGGRRVGVGVSVGVVHAHDLQAPALGVAVGLEVVEGVELVQPARFVRVPAAVDALDLVVAGPAGEQAAGF